MHPTMLYKHGGPHEIHGGKFDYCIVDADDAEAFARALADGWHETTDAAKSAVESCEDDDAPPTRAELEQKASELGLKWHGNASDRKLGEMIAQALKGL